MKEFTIKIEVPTDLNSPDGRDRYDRIGQETPAQALEARVEKEFKDFLRSLSGTYPDVFITLVKNEVIEEDLSQPVRETYDPIEEHNAHDWDDLEQLLGVDPS